MSKEKKLKLTLHPIHVGKTFPAVWEGVFNRIPTSTEVRDKELKFEGKMQDDLNKQITRRKSLAGFKLTQRWRKAKNDPQTVFLRITATRRASKAQGGNGGDVTPPQPKSPPPPPQ